MWQSESHSLPFSPYIFTFKCLLQWNVGLAQCLWLLLYCILCPHWTFSWISYFCFVLWRSCSFLSEGLALLHVPTNHRWGGSNHSPSSCTWVEAGLANVPIPLIFSSRVSFQALPRLVQPMHQAARSSATFLALMPSGPDHLHQQNQLSCVAEAWCGAHSPTLQVLQLAQGRISSHALMSLRPALNHRVIRINPSAVHTWSKMAPRDIERSNHDTNNGSNFEEPKPSKEHNHT